jgi:uncharacterized protein YutE (UPF0331/DUF86 family)
MTTKPPSEVNYLGDDEPLKKIYNLTEELSEIITFPNDRYRLAYCLNQYFENYIGTVLEAIDQAKPRSGSTDYKELEKMIKIKFNEKGLTK